MDEPETKSIKAVETAFDIIELLESEGPLSLAKIADQLEYSQSTIYYYLNTLSERHAVLRTEDGYEIGPKFLSLGQQVQERTELWHVGREYVDELARQTGHLACAVVAFDGIAVIVHVESAKSFNEKRLNVRPGTEFPLHTTAYGQAILANYSTDRIESYLESHNVSDLETSIDQVLSVRNDGFAFSDESNWEEMRSIASPVVTDDGEKVLGSVGVTGPADQIEDPNMYKRERRFVSGVLDRVQDTADSIEEAL